MGFKTINTVEMSPATPYFLGVNYFLFNSESKFIKQ
jgi:hypothetical protein